MSGLYVRARDVRLLLAKSLFPPEPKWEPSVPMSEWSSAHDRWCAATAPWDALRDLVLHECQRHPFLAETLFAKFLDIPAFADEAEETAWREAQRWVRAAVADSGKRERQREKARRQAARRRAAARALQRCTCQHCPVHRGWAKATHRRLVAAVSKA